MPISKKIQTLLTLFAAIAFIFASGIALAIFLEEENTLLNLILTISFLIIGVIQIAIAMDRHKKMLMNQ